MVEASRVSNAPPLPSAVIVRSSASKNGDDQTHEEASAWHEPIRSHGVQRLKGRPRCTVKAAAREWSEHDLIDGSHRGGCFLPGIISLGQFRFLRAGGGQLRFQGLAATDQLRHAASAGKWRQSGDCVRPGRAVDQVGGRGSAPGRRRLVRGQTGVGRRPRRHRRGYLAAGRRLPPDAADRPGQRAGQPRHARAGHAIPAPVQPLLAGRRPLLHPHRL